MTRKDRVSPALLTDLYQLTMAYGYWKTGMLNHDAVFNVFFRVPPFNGGYTIACGLSDAIDYLQNFKFEADDLQYIGALVGTDEQPLFSQGFIDYLEKLDFRCSVDAVPEGTVVFPHEPLLRVTGPLLQCQLFETGLLNILNFQTLIATKSARIRLAAKGAPVLEFGLRRAHGPDGALAASRAAYIGGCAASSNVLAGKVFGIPVRGTHAHSWVMSFSSEIEAFRAFAESMPGNTVFLVDTYNSVTGVHHAVEVGKTLRDQGKELTGIRLDSGDLAFLSVQARKLLDQAGFRSTKILASNDLDEYVIESLHEQGAVIDQWGVGTKLVTAFDQPALGGVYKLGAIRATGGEWQFKIKLSDQAAKVSNPGSLQIRRFEYREEYFADMIYNEGSNSAPGRSIIDIIDVSIHRTMPSAAKYHDLLVPVFRSGALTYEQPSIHDIRKFAMDELTHFYAGVKRLLNPHIYPVGLDQGLHNLKVKLIREARQHAIDLEE
jgi:nicotinate phosphoribosyltransferase